MPATPVPQHADRQWGGLGPAFEARPQPPPWAPPAPLWPPPAPPPLPPVPPTASPKVPLLSAASVPPAGVASSLRDGAKGDALANKDVNLRPIATETADTTDAVAVEIDGGRGPEAKPSLGSSTSSEATAVQSTR
eukprot:2166357-Prymnesium_polylepis.3